MKKYLALLLVISTVFLAVSCIAENNSSAPEGSDVSVPNESSRPQKEEDEYSPIGSFTFGIRSDEGYRQMPLVTKVTAPECLGALIVCSGGDDPEVKLRIVNAVCSLTGLGSDRVTILKMEGI